MCWKTDPASFWGPFVTFQGLKLAVGFRQPLEWFLWFPRNTRHAPPSDPYGHISSDAWNPHPATEKARGNGLLFSTLLKVPNKGLRDYHFGHEKNTHLDSFIKDRHPRSPTLGGGNVRWAHYTPKSHQNVEEMMRKLPSWVIFKMVRKDQVSGYQIAISSTTSTHLYKIDVGSMTQNRCRSQHVLLLPKSLPQYPHSLQQKKNEPPYQTPTPTVIFPCLLACKIWAKYQDALAWR